MSERLIVVSAAPRYQKAIAGLASDPGILACQIYTTSDQEHDVIHFLVTLETRQEVLDRLQGILSGTEDWRLTILPVEASVPRVADEAEQALGKAKRRKPSSESREELYAQVAQNAEPNGPYLTFVGLSAVVAAIGLIENNVAVVIGAMVIAPLLAPILAFCLGVALGDRGLMARSAATGGLGLLVVVALGAAISLFLPVPLDSAELLARTQVGFGGMALALASGAAAALSMTTGLSAALVGVMVAVALMPPAVTIGLMLGAQEWSNALGATLLLAVDIVCLNLSAQVAFVARGVTPRTWLEKRAARRAVIVNVVIWCLLLVALAALLIRLGTTF
ncbi:MAG: TIGR00341 family protein [Pseudomonadota bacterium]